MGNEQKQNKQNKKGRTTKTGKGGAAAELCFDCGIEGEKKGTAQNRVVFLFFFGFL